MSFEEVKKNLDERVNVIAKGWAKMPSIQKRNALKRLIHKVEINKQGIGIYYYFNSLKDERTLGTLLVEKSRAA
ncbi:MAG: hypothetical protein NDI63_15460, partial [Pseudobdellovibrio sp.]|nr:hypothetical protein [Pseudobdellovibrio sp.]